MSGLRRPVCINSAVVSIPPLATKHSKDSHISQRVDNARYVLTLARRVAGKNPPFVNVGDLIQGAREAVVSMLVSLWFVALECESIAKESGVDDENFWGDLAKED